MYEYSTVTDVQIANVSFSLEHTSTCVVGQVVFVSADSQLSSVPLSQFTSPKNSQRLALPVPVAS